MRSSLRRGTLVVLLLVYLGSLAASHVARRLTPPATPVPRGESLALPVVDGARTLESTTRLAYADLRPSGNAESPVVVLLHGSPGRGHDFHQLAPALAERFRVLVPDLPGFGDSWARLPDYSIRAHARYVDAWLRSLGVERAHLLGFSMGGGVAIELYDRAPERVASLTLLSAIGVQELELLGDYRLNHSVHAAQLAGLWLLAEAVPHFGLLDSFPLNVAYARNFFDSDQRPLRGILEGFRPPLLIVHGASDFLVAPEVAREHQRLVPQSELLMLDGSHFMVFSRGSELARPIAEFVRSVEAGEARTRDAADRARVARADRKFRAGELPTVAGLGLLLVMFLIAVATLVSEDLTCIGVGLLAGQGRIELLPGVVACCAGILVGDILLFLTGRWLGRPALAHRPLSWWIHDSQVDAASRWFRERGPAVILLSRFLPGLRLPTYFTAGVLRTGFFRFCLYFALAVAVWTPILVGVSALVGARLLVWFEAFRIGSSWLLAIAALWILLMLRVGPRLLTRDGRLELLGSIRRWTTWEFWPLGLFYIPVVLRVAWLGLRHRGPLVFTAANPGIPAGGSIRESKSEILGGLADAGDVVAPYRLLPGSVPPARRVEHALEFASGVGYPVVLKPDAGQRGSGVAIVRSRAEVADYLAGAPYDVIIQTHVPGHEYGIFYFRYPGEERGRIFSITDKRMPTVVGNGRHTLEQLVLRDRRAACLHRVYRRALGSRKDDVPAAGERVRLVELGTHCRGAVFLDGSALRTEALEVEIDRISRSFSGFLFGRYDVRVPDEDALRRGENLRIIELNGVTSEATHIYDPRYSPIDAWRTLFEQWRIAFEIGAANRARGVRPTGPAELLRLILDYRRLAAGHPD